MDARRGSTSRHKAAPRSLTAAPPLQVPPDTPPQRVLVETGGEVSTVHVRTSDCRTLKQLRRRIAQQCRAGGSAAAAEASMVLEYLDEEKALAILVDNSTSVEAVLSRPTLKATFAAPVPKRQGRGTRTGAPAPPPQPARPRPRLRDAMRGRRRGYERAVATEEDADAQDVGAAVAGSCALQ